MHAIVTASVRARNAAGRLVLVSAAPHVDRVFILKGSSHRGEIYADPTGPAVEPLPESHRGAANRLTSGTTPLRAVSMRRIVSGMTFAGLR